MTVSDLPVLSKIRFGRYSVENESPHKICWVKYDEENSMITEFIEDYRAFDAKEPMYDYGNPLYSVSNIDQWFNSSDETWYTPAHPDDMPPSEAASSETASTSYETHFGFLALFRSWELKCMMVMTETVNTEVVERRVLLPRDTKVPAPIKRTTCSPECHVNSRQRDQLRSYWIIDEADAVGHVRRYSETEGVYNDRPFWGDIGVRPIIRLAPDTLVSNDPVDGYYEVIEQINEVEDFNIFDLI